MSLSVKWHVGKQRPNRMGGCVKNGQRGTTSDLPTDKSPSCRGDILTYCRADVASQNLPPESTCPVPSIAFHVQDPTKCYLVATGRAVTSERQPDAGSVPHIGVRTILILGR